MIFGGKNLIVLRQILILVCGPSEIAAPRVAGAIRQGDVLRHDIHRSRIQHGRRKAALGGSDAIGRAVSADYVRLCSQRLRKVAETLESCGNLSTAEKTSDRLA